MVPLKKKSFIRSGVVSCLMGLLVALGFSMAFAREPGGFLDLTPTEDAGKPQTGLPETNMAVGTHIYRIEVASTPEQSETGLMYRTYLAPNHGMLFTFSPPRPVSFWMKNTKIPLDMLFLAHGKLLHIFENVPPCVSEPCQTYGIPALTDMVLELPAGTARRDHLVAGLTAEVRGPVQEKRQPVSQGK